MSRTGSVRIRNLVAACEDLQCDLTALALSGADWGDFLGDLLARLRVLVKRVEIGCLKAGGNPGDLPAPSRRAYLWLRFLSDEVHLRAHLGAVREITGLASGTGGRELSIRFRNLPGLFRVRSTGGALELVVHEAFVAAPREVLAALVASARDGRGGQARATVRGFAASGEFARLAWLLEHGGTGSAAKPRGQVYDLQDLFDRLNAVYFAGLLARPVLTWSRSVTRRKFGHYQPSTDTIMVSATLDDPSVPPFVVEFVLFHEMLHKELGSKTVNGRTWSHTPAFRRAERRFPRHAEAQSHLTRLSASQPPARRRRRRACTR